MTYLADPLTVANATPAEPPLTLVLLVTTGILAFWALLNELALRYVRGQEPEGMWSQLLREQRERLLADDRNPTTPHVAGRKEP